MSELNGGVLRGGGDSKKMKTMIMWSIAIILAGIILWYVVPRVWEYFSPTQEEVVPVEVKVKTWHDLLPPPEKKAVVTDFGQPEFQTPVASVMPTKPNSKRSKK